MGAADFYDILKGFLFVMERLIDGIHGREQLLFNEQDTGHVKACREGIVRTLGMVDVVIGMDALLFPFFFENSCRPVGYDFIDVHIELSPAAGHPNGQWEIAVQFPCQNIVTGRGDGIGLIGIDDAQFFIGQGCRFFQIGKDGDHFGGNLFRTDLKIFKAALGLSAPEFICRDFNLSH